MKKTLTVLLAAAMMLAAAGCSEGSEEYSIPELKEVPKVTEKYDSSAVNTDMFAREGEFFLPSGKKGKELFSCDSEVPLKKDTICTKIRKVYEQDGMLVVEIEARSGYEKTLTSIYDFEYTITDKNDNLIAHYTFEYLRDEKGKIVKLAPERTVDAMLVFPAGSYTTKGVDFSTLSWHSSSNFSDDDDSSKASTSRTDSSSSDSAVRLPSGARGDLLFSCKDAYTRVKDNLEFQVRYIYRQGDDLVVRAEVYNGYSYEIDRIYSVDFQIQAKNNTVIAKDTFPELHDLKGKRVTLKPSQNAVCLFVFPKGTYNIKDVDFEHLTWNYHFKHSKKS